MKLKFLTSMTLIAMAFALPALAMDLQEARNTGLVGEARAGYVQAIGDNPEIAEFVADINAKRKAEYVRISQENGQPSNIVAKMAAEQILNRLRAGNYYEGADGSWKKR